MENEQNNFDLEKILDFELLLSKPTFPENTIISAGIGALAGGFIAALASLPYAAYLDFFKSGNYDKVTADSNICSFILAGMAAGFIFPLVINPIIHTKRYLEYKKAPKTTRELIQYCKRKGITETKIKYWETFDVHPLGAEYSGLSYFGKKKGKYKWITSTIGLSNIASLGGLALGFNPLETKPLYLCFANLQKELFEKEGIKCKLKF